GNNLIDGGAGIDGMYGELGDDAYTVDNNGDVVIENANEGNDTVYASVNYLLGDNVENLIQTGSGDLQGYGNALANSIFGNAGSNLIDGGAGADFLTGNAGDDYFLFQAGQGDGDTVIDFEGAGDAAGDTLLFAGYGADATFTFIDAFHWQVNYNGG